MLVVVPLCTMVVPVGYRLQTVGCTVLWPPQSETGVAIAETVEVVVVGVMVPSFFGAARAALWVETLRHA